MSKPLGHQILAVALKLIEDPKYWTQHRGERRAYGPRPSLFSRRPYIGKARCLDGAIREAAISIGAPAAADMARQLLYTHTGWRSVTDIHRFNDTHRHHEVVAVGKAALSAA